MQYKEIQRAIMSLLYLLLISYFACFLWGFFREIWRTRRAANAPTPSAQLARALTTPDSPPLTAEQVTMLRPLALHWIGLRTDLADNRIPAEVPKTLRQRWYTLDLHYAGAGSNPHAALAFACLRCAFYLRATAALGWLEATLYSQLTHLNVLRIRECFADWPTFCHAYQQGRNHWQTSGRTDIFGEHLTPEQLQAWLWPQMSA